MSSKFNLFKNYGLKKTGINYHCKYRVFFFIFQLKVPPIFIILGSSYCSYDNEVSLKGREKLMSKSSGRIALYELINKKRFESAQQKVTAEMAERPKQHPESGQMPATTKADWQIKPKTQTTMYLIQMLLLLEYLKP